MIRPGSAPVREGDLLAGKYRVERVLGAGGMGIVVAARHVELDQLVAIKFVRDEALDNEQGVQRFLREARAAVKLKSEHVARVLDVGKLESGAPYMVMEYLEGSDLGKVLAEQGPLPLDSAADWIMQACEAVAEAHAAGIVHRDLKPENLFLTRAVGGAPKVKVLDFGVSKAVQGSSGELSGLTRTRAMLGSPLYMSPEQMRSSRDVDSRADIWALGVVLFQLLTGRWPFEADTMPELCLKVVTDPPLSLAAFRPDVPQAMVAVVERCLAKDLTKRYAQAAELASALEPFVQPASRVLAERARRAIAGSLGIVGSGAVRSVPASTQLSGPSPVSGSERFEVNTPVPEILRLGVNTPAAGGVRPGGNTPASEIDRLGVHTPPAVSGRLGANAPPAGSGRLGVNTPATSAAWGGGAERGGSTPVPVARRRRVGAAVGIVAVGAAASVVLAFALRRPATDPVPAPASATSSVAPEGPTTPRIAEPAAPVPIAPSASEAVLAPPVLAASAASVAITHGPKGAPPPPVRMAPSPSPPLPPPHQGVPRALQDDDIPTIR